MRFLHIYNLCNSQRRLSPAAKLLLQEKRDRHSLEQDHLKSASPDRPCETYGFTSIKSLLPTGINMLDSFSF